jgi:hypothetical protein
MRRSRAGLVLLLVLAGGCIPLSLQEFLDPDAAAPATTAVPSSPFGSPGPAAPPAQVTYKTSSAETGLALRVDAVGRKVLAANPQTGLQPYFQIYGTPTPEVFHQGTKIVHITDALVKQCKTDGELAAVLAVEFGKMVAEREALVSSRVRGPEQGPPIEVPIGNAGQAGGGAVDQARLVELARFEKRRREAAKAATPPDPQQLAAGYLENAGFARADLDAVRPLLRSAEGNYVLEKQFRQSGAPGWTAPPL